YDVIRPLVVGGVDLSPLYRQIQNPDAVILDVGCGTGTALRYLDRFQSYTGMDVDPVAVQHARSRYASANVSFSAQICTPEDVRRVAPSDVVLAGVMHHLNDDEVVGLLRSFLESRRLAQVLTADIVFLPRHPVGNLLARLDRGRFCRSEKGYLELVAQAGLTVRSRFIVRSRPRTGLGKYQYLTLVPPGA
ncbi:MAG TPA: class I SAM-dependent methyltransferase, partial [Polyangiaceae bacterium]|nr:class I SAM-dependent methyltransferase [Polyangiaceae bacterium]